MKLITNFTNAFKVNIPVMLKTRRLIGLHTIETLFFFETEKNPEIVSA